MKIAAFALTVLALLSGEATAAPAAPGETQKITIDARGPLALVEVTRTVAPLPSETTGGPGGEALVDLALPDGGALVALEVRDGGRWRAVEPASEGTRAAEVYRGESAARGVTAANEPYDEDATHRLRLVRGAAHRSEPFTVRYRFAVLPTAAHGRLLVRFPAAPERLPPAADVTLKLRAAADAEIAGVRTDLAPSGGTAVGHVSTRGGWQVAWTPRDRPARDAAPLEARLAMAPLSPAETAVAFLARHRAGEPIEPPGSVLFLVDRSRSVGLPGLSVERDLVRAVIEALPPSTRFDALFFARATKRLFPMSRPATREAIESFENEMVPDRLQNGTDLPAALRDAGALLRREATTFAPRAWLVLVTDGALGDDAPGAALDRALGSLPGLDLALAALTIRPVDDEPASARAREALSALVAARGGVARELRANEVGDAVPALLEDLRRGGDLGAIRLVSDGKERQLSERLPPGDAIGGVVVLKGRPPRKVELAATARGQRVAVGPPAVHLEPEWLHPWIADAHPGPRLLNVPSLLVLVEPVLHARVADDTVRGSMDRMMIRNVLSLAYMPRARACYLNRTAATAALRDLTGKVRLAIDLGRGEVERATIESSTLDNPDIERCLTESAFEIEVPRAMRSDAPVTAVLNMNFRPRTPDKKADVDLGAVGDQIDLVIEEMERREAARAPSSTAPLR